MTLKNIRLSNFLPALCLLAFCFAVPSNVLLAQVKPPVKPLSAYNFIDSIASHAVPARMPKPARQAASRPAGNIVCNNSTFYMHLKAEAGKKVDLRDIQTTEDGNFLLAGNVTLVNNEQEGLLCLLSSSGNIITQKQIRINNRPATIYNAKTKHNGQAVVAGIMHDAADKVFVALLNADLSINWLKTIDDLGASNTALDIIEDDKIYVAAQSGNQVTYHSISNAGAITWQKTMSITGLDNIAGIGHNFFELTLSANTTVAGKKQVQLFTINTATGDILNGSILGDGIEENRANKVTSFNGRVSTTGITKKNDGSFIITRQIMYNAVTTETSHTYNITEPIDFTVSSALDIPADAMGFSFPSGKLLFVRHFAYYQTPPEHFTFYDIPPGSVITGVTKSSLDGGFLFALNNASAGESILIKTDSAGILSGCNYQKAALNYIEGPSISAVVNPSAANASTVSIQNTNVTENSVSLSSSFDCRQVYCPAPPAEDTCLSSYYKTLRSNSYIDAFTTYQLLNGNKHLIVTQRLNNSLGDLNEVTYGVKLFDERGNFLKGVNVFDENGFSAPVFSRPVDDRHVMLVYYSQVDTVPSFTFILMDDNLQVIWKKSVKTFKDFYFFSGGSGGYVVHDKDGNFYFFANTAGIFEKAKVLVYKMDSGGNPLWLKFYEIDATILLNIGATTTPTSLFLMLDGKQDGSVSLRIDKQSGNMLNAFNFQNTGDNTIYPRLVQFDGDRIFYAGNDAQGHFDMGIFDTTAKPIQFKSINAIGSIMRAATVKSGKLFGIFNYINGSEYKDVLFRADTALKVEYANEFDMMRFGFPGGMAVSDEGNIYVTGNYLYGGNNGSYYDPFIKKFDDSGLIGTCAYQKFVADINDIDLQTKPISFREIQVAPFTAVDIPLSFVPDTYGQQVAEVLCSSNPVCNSIKLTGTNKVCQLNVPFTYHAVRNVNCTLKPLWQYDTSMVSINVVDDTTAAISYKKFGSTWLKLKLNAGCSFFLDSMLVTIQQSPAAFKIGNDTAICTGTSLVVTAGTGFNSYLWQDGSTDSKFTVTKAGTYWVSVSNVCGDVYKDTIIVQTVIVPALFIGSDTSICKGDTLQLTANNGFSQYSWQPVNNILGQGNTVKVLPALNTSVNVMATTKEGCKAFDTLVLSVITPKQLSLGNDTSFCKGDSITLSATGYQQYIWNTGAITSSIKIKQAGLYSLAATDRNGCKLRDTLIVQLYPSPNLSLGNDFSLCAGTNRQLDAGNFSQYLWQDGSTARYYTANNTGDYWVTVKDIYSCIASDTVSIKSILALPKNFLPPSDSICQYETITLTTLNQFPFYEWSTGASQPSISVQAPGLYTLTVKDLDGCQGTDSISIYLKDCFAGIYIPTAFTPNNDAKNDIFKPVILGTLLSYQLEIFNRFGEPVFKTTDIKKGWNGTYRGQLLPTSSFTWQCSYQFAGQLKRFKKGNVVLIR